MPSAVHGPLHGLRVVELAAIGPVPFCGMLLADMGAEILHVSGPHGSEYPVPAELDPVARGRTRVSLDLKRPAARGALLEVLRHADVLIEGFRPGVLERLSIGPEVCLGANPRLVIGRMTGFGQSGPLSQAPGHDPNYLALTGALHAIGPAAAPPCPPLNLVADLGGGALYLALGVLAGLLHARSGGSGQVVDAAMVDGATSLMSMVYALHNHGLWRDERGANLFDGGAPFGRTYQTADGRYVAVCALEPRFYAALLEGLGLEGEPLPAPHERAGWPLLQARFAEVFRTRTRAEWVRRLEGTDACVTGVLSLGEAPDHPHNRARSVFVGDPPAPAPAPRFSGTPSALAAMQGRVPRELLAGWGMQQAAIEQLLRAQTEPGSQEAS